MSDAAVLDSAVLSDTEDVSSEAVELVSMSDTEDVSSDAVEPVSYTHLTLPTN